MRALMNRRARIGRTLAPIPLMLALALLVPSLPAAATSPAEADGAGPQVAQESPPAPDVQFSEGAAWAQAGPVATRSDPTWDSTVCSPVAAFDWELFASADSQTAVAHANTAASTAEGAPGCFHALWTLDPGTLTNGGEYSVRSRSVDGSGTASEWSPLLSFPVVYGPDPADPATPADGEAQTVASPTLTATVHARGSESLRAVFDVVRAETDAPVAQGASEVADQNGAVSWTVPVALPIGRYRWRVLAWDGLAQSSCSEPREFTVSLPPPDAPQIGYLVNNVRSGVTVSWLPVATGENDPILDFTVDINPGNHTVVVPGDTTSAVVSGLVEGTYSVTVTARNRRGSSPSAAAKAVYVYPEAPLAVQNLRYEQAGTSATVSWDPPLDQGASPVTYYEVRPWWAATFPRQRLLGNLTSSVAVYGDVRDLMASAFELRPADGAIIAVGLVPGIGDSIEGIAKVGKFIARVGDDAAAARPARELLHRAVGGDATKFVDEMLKTYPDLVAHLRALEVSESSIELLLRKNSPKYLEDLLSRPGATVVLVDAAHIAADATEDAAKGFMKTGKAGEGYLRRSLGLDEAKNFGCIRAIAADPCRFPDAISIVDDVQTLHESKVGFVRGLFASKQVLKDVKIRSADTHVELLWHFFASGRTGKVGASVKFLDDLDAFSVRYIIHLPR